MEITENGFEFIEIGSLVKAIAYQLMLTRCFNLKGASAESMQISLRSSDGTKLICALDDDNRLLGTAQCSMLYQLCFRPIALATPFQDWHPLSPNKPMYKQGRRHEALSQSRAGGQGPYLRSLVFGHLGRSSEAKDRKKCSVTDRRTGKSGD